MIIKRVEKHRIDKNHPLYEKCDALCFNAKNVYNQATYLIRQKFIETSEANKEDNSIKVTIPSRTEIYNLMKDGETRGEMSSYPFSCILKVIYETWKGFFKSCKEYKKYPSKYTGCPKMPGYLHKESGRFTFLISNNHKNKDIIIKDEYVRFALKDLQDFNGIFKTHITNYERICMVRIVPKNGYYNLELIFDIEVPDDVNEETFENKRIAAIDPGLNNLATIVTNIGTTPIVINGKPLKSINQYYNKKFATLKSEAELRNGVKTTKRIQSLINKRNAKIENYMHRASKMIIEYLCENKIDTLVIGHNCGWKQNKKDKEFLTKNQKDAEKRNHQNFNQIPHTVFFNMLAYKAENKGIKVIVREESYTSGTSFLDYEEPIKENYNPDRRIERGMFITNNGIKINADVNAAYQILVKEFSNAIIDRESVIKHPIIKNIEGSFA